MAYGIAFNGKGPAFNMEPDTGQHLLGSLKMAGFQRSDDTR